MDKKTWENDWRNLGQLDYLYKKEIKKITQYQPYNEQWEHEHCIFCWEKISPYQNDQHSGYCTIDKKDWICESCFNDLQDLFQWQVVE